MVHVRVPVPVVALDDERPGLPVGPEDLAQSAPVHQIHGWRGALVHRWVDVESGQSDVLAGPEWCGRPGMRPGRVDDRVDVGAQRLSQAQPREERDDLTRLSGAVDAERLGLMVEPEPADVRGLPAFRGFGQLQHTFAVLLRVRLVLDVVPVTPLVEVGRGFLAVEVDQGAGGLEQLRIGNRAHPLDEVLVNGSVHVGEAVGVPPAQIGFECLTDHVVREEARVRRFDEGLPTQPGEQLGSLFAYEGPEQ